MPIGGWICSGCGDREVPLDHFDQSECGLTTCEPDYAAAVLRQEREHYAAGSSTVEVTHLTSCPRKVGIQKREAYSVNPCGRSAALTGTAFHREVKPTSAPKYLLKGVLDGVAVMGEADKLDRERSLVLDWKHQNDFSRNYIRKEGAKREWAHQVSTYGELCAQQEGWRPTRGIIVNHTTAAGPLHFRIEPLMGVEELLAFRPLYSPYTSRELLHTTDDVLSDRKAWRDLPLYGQQMVFGDPTDAERKSKPKTLCSYCDAYSICTEAAKGAPW